MGKKGVRGSGITIRFTVDLHAREGIDFILHGDPHQDRSYVVWRNKNAIRVIPESLEMSLLQYFEFLAEGKEISKDDQALLWKLKRRLQHSLTAGITSPDELKKIRQLVLAQMKSKANNSDVVFHEWLNFEGMRLGQNSIEVSEMLKSGEYRANPAPFVSGLEKFASGTELEAWIHQEYLPGLLSGLKPDIGDRAIESCLFSAHPEMKVFGLQRSGINTFYRTQTSTTNQHASVNKTSGLRNEQQERPTACCNG